MDTQDDKYDSQVIQQNTEEEQGITLPLKKKNYIKLRNLSKYDIYLRVLHTENERDYEVAKKDGFKGTGPGFSATVGRSTRVVTRSQTRAASVLVSDPGGLPARKGKICKKRRIYTSIKGDARTAISAFVKFDKSIDYRDLDDEEDRGRLYLFKDMYCGPKYIRNMKTEHVNALRREFREGDPQRNSNIAVCRTRSTGKRKDMNKEAGHTDDISEGEKEALRLRYFAKWNDKTPDISEFTFPDSPCSSQDSGIDNVDFDDFQSSDGDYDVDFDCESYVGTKTKRSKKK